MFRLCFLLFVCLVSPIIATTVSKCQVGDIPLPRNVDVYGCSAQPCNFVRGEETVMDLTFESPHLITLFKPLAAAWALQTCVPSYPLNIDDGCETLVNSECPLDEGDVATYHFSFEVLKAFPLVSLSIEFTLVDQDNLPIVCFNITGQTVDP